MDYVLPALLLVGVLLLLLSWFLITIAGFRHHPVTGLFAMIPGVNLIILPTIWHRASGWVIAGTMGLLLAAGAWFMGAETKLYQQINTLGSKVSAPAATHAPTAAAPAHAATPPARTQTFELPARTTQPTPAPSAPNQTTATLPIPSAAPPVNTQAAAPAQAQSTTLAIPPAAVPAQDLPSSALYRLTFESIPLDKLKQATGKYIRLIQTDGRHREGKLQSATDAAITLEERIGNGTTTLNIRSGDIREASVMVKKAEGE